MLVDTHCHLDFPQFDLDREEVIRRAKDSQIKYIINIGSSLEGSYHCLELAQKYDFIYAAVGIHPHEAENLDFFLVLPELESLAKNKKVVAIGEIGLDYHSETKSSAQKQKQLFLNLLKLAKKLNLPVIIHNRQAQKDLLPILKEFLPLKVVLHCFSGDEKFLENCLDLGFFVSFTCNVTYKNAYQLKELVRITPLERMMLETDAPFLPPQPLRGKRNEPAYLKYLLDEISKIKKIFSSEIAQITTQNAEEFFSLR